MCRSPCAAATSRAAPGRARSRSLPRRRTAPTPHPPPGRSEPRAATSLLVSAFGVVTAPAPAPRRLAAHHIAGLERHAHFRSEGHAVQERAPTRPVAPARGSARGVAPSLGQNACLHRRERLELPHHPVAPPPLAHAPTPPSQAVRLKPYGILHLQHLDRGV